MLCCEALQIALGEFTLGADFALPPGSRTALVGPSGAGKSTLLAAVAGFVAPRAGRIAIDGRDVTGTSPGARPLSIVFQDNNLFPHMTAAENVGLGLRSDLRLDAAERRQVAAVLARVGLKGLERRRPAALSGGQQSRVALARVLLRRRPWILLDEPFAALGPAQKRDMLDLVAEVCAETGAGLVMVTHDPGDAAYLCPQTVVVADGAAMAPAPTGQVLADPPPALVAYLGR